MGISVLILIILEKINRLFDAVNPRKLLWRSGLGAILSKANPAAFAQHESLENETTLDAEARADFSGLWGAGCSPKTDWLSLLRCEHSSQSQEDRNSDAR